MFQNRDKSATVVLIDSFIEEGVRNVRSWTGGTIIDELVYGTIFAAFQVDQRLG